MPEAVKSENRSHAQTLAKLQHEVDALRRQLQRSQRLAALGTMTAMVAHEFRNILTPMINYAQLARENPSLIDKAIARAADDGQRATEICGAILGLTGDEHPEPVETNLAKLVDRTLAAMARDPGKDGIEMRLKIPPALSLRTRRCELQQVILNLLMNARTAVMARRAPRIIDITASKSGRAIRLQITDNGPGIPPENLDKIFEPFFTTATATSGDGQGHGLGLTICRQIIAALGGKIEVTSDPGAGSTFTISLPT